MFNLIFLFFYIFFLTLTEFFLFLNNPPSCHVLGLFFFIVFVAIFLVIISVFLSLAMVLFFIFIFMSIIKKLRLDHSFRCYIMRKISQFILDFCRFRILVHNTHLIPQEGNLVIYSNHKSNFDPFIIASLVPRTLAFSPKNELYKSYFGFLGFCFNSCNCVKIVRGDEKTTVQNLWKAIPNIRKNLVMVVFHEGGVVTKYTDRITHSLDGAFQIAIKSQSQILPITLKGVCKIRGKFLFRKATVEVFIHEPIFFETYRYQKTQEINKKVTSIINSVL